MSKEQPVTDLEELFDCIGEAAAQNTHEKVSIDSIMDMIGRRSFGPLLLLAGLIILAPVIGDIPGVPSIMGMFIFLVAIQLLIGQEHFWLPNWLLQRAVPADKLIKAVEWLRKPAHYIDKLIRPRLPLFVNGIAKYLIAVVCILIALMLPFMEVIPFSANAGGLALVAFGLALIARDGLLALFSFILTGLTVWLIIANLF
ncbi:exopolysaccharide biosynthesis protein [Methylophaga pinxianii]|uniref:exopolysaccharide biosynthesis protein n=1 Tax=Methylophaga pinxianii TaxID=2881052 RepID=UPI001CF3B7D1|nr:exopolysaccharide biosynthesis protein [Methylophaga pinxianii]MCB2427651.1 exopolysaccharide biosynthesis protein [Methylophaga pinxianii]UPH46640.1 exopolysaccharide biosynthesis protein [Methylophaga pinxianii]